MANMMPGSAANLRSALNARFIASLIALLVPLASACGGDDESPKSLYSEPCTMDADCAAALMCNEAIGICTQSCATPQECRNNLGSQTAVCLAGSCQEPCRVGSTSDCGPGTRCIEDFAGATCRAQ
jgi:hypothetical protein